MPCYKAKKHYLREFLQCKSHRNCGTCDVQIMMSGADDEYGIPPGVKMGYFTVGS